MLSIRKEQMQSMHQAMLEQFEDKMLEHVQQFFPAKVAQYGEKQTREIIRIGMQVAPSHQITIQKDVGKYIDMMFLIRPDFDTNPSTRWAGLLLADTSQPPERRLSKIQRAAHNRGLEISSAEQTTHNGVES